NMFKTSGPEMRRPDGDRSIPHRALSHDQDYPFVARADRQSVCTHKVNGLLRRSSESKLQLRAKAIHIIRMGLV
ncbi:MAG TPA: hypothetical protein VK577_20415, partial [Bradyrhizobium sp.]|nr:hypothetical protein [Bradyrhizobium sp.]